MKTIDPLFNICIYDGISIFIQQQEFINHILSHKEKYNLILSNEKHGEIEVLKFWGKYKNISISYITTSKGKGIKLGGSLHKWKRGTHNHDTFYWGEFLEVYQEIIDEFKFDPSQARILSLEGGLNNPLPDHFKFKAKDYPINTILLMGDPKVSNRQKFTNNGYALTISKGECRYKIYDKSSQFELENEIVRTECACKKRPLFKHGLVSFEDLLDYSKHLSYAEFLLKAFDSLILFQSDVLEGYNISEPDRLFLSALNSSRHWIELRRKSDYQFKKSIKRYLSLINEHSPINYRTELLTLMKNQIN